MFSDYDRWKLATPPEYDWDPAFPDYWWEVGPDEDEWLDLLSQQEAARYE